MRHLVPVFGALILVTAVLPAPAWASGPDRSLPPKVTTGPGSVTVGVERTTPGTPGTSTPTTDVPVVAPPGPSGPSAPSSEPQLAPGECIVRGGVRTCALDAVDGPGQPAAAPRSVAETEAIVRAASLRLELPSADPMVGPDPSWNEWNALPVGFPVWLWSESGSKSSEVTQGGISISLVATHASTVFDLGDGHSVVCSAMSRFDRVLTPSGAVSPDCGYKFPMKGTFMVTATSTWNVVWSAEGHSGVVQVTRSGSRTLQIIELESVRKR